MRSGKLDRKIDIEKFTETLDSYGEPIKSWTKLAFRRAAGYRPLSGAERYGEDQYISRQQVEFTIRYSAALANINPLDRIIYPAQAVTSPASEPSEDDIFDVIAVHEIGRRQGLRIITARRSEVRSA